MDKDRADAVNWYRQVLQLLIIHELGKHQVMVPFQWDHFSEVWYDLHTFDIHNNVDGYLITLILLLLGANILCDKCILVGG
jgi:hypothetical protein